MRSLPNPSPVEIQPVTVDDIPTLAALERVIFPTPWSEIAIRQHLAFGGHIRLAKLEQQIVGYFLERHVAGIGELMNLGVVPENRRQGVGRTLLEGLIVWWLAHDVGEGFLEVRVGNQAAMALYTEFGFTVVGQRKGYYDNPDGSKEDALVMRWLRDGGEEW